MTAPDPHVLPTDPAPSAPAHPASPPPRRRWLRSALGAAAVAAVGGAGWGGWRWWSGRQEPAESPLLLTVQRGDIEDLVAATGTLQPRNYVDVGAQVSGQLRRLAVEVGDEVREGDLLAEIDAEQTAARVDAYRAQIRNQQAQLAEGDISLAKAERDLRRQRQLLADDATTQETLQNAETTLAAARASRESILAQIAQIQATMRVEEANLKYTRLLAPLSGTVVSITARQGQTLNTNQSAPTVLRVADLSLMTVQAQVSEADVARLRLGMPVYFTTLGSPGRRWPGRLQKIEPTPTVTNNVVLYNALFEVPNPQRQLMTQMTAQVFFVVAQVQDVLVVPMAALTLARGGRRGEGAAAPASAPQEAGAARPAAAASRPPADGGAPRGDGPRGDGRPREDWSQLSEEERERRRAERRAAREVAARAVPVDHPPRRPPRKATVKVMKADGQIEERDVLIGVSNRVHAEVLSGLEAGEQVVAGIKRAGQDRQRQGGTGGQTGAGQAGTGGLQGGMPGGVPGMGPGGPGGR